MGTPFRRAFREAQRDQRQVFDRINASEFYGYGAGGKSGLSFGESLELAFAGRLQETMDALDEALLRAARDALERVVERGKSRLRDHVIRAGLGRQGTQGGGGPSLANAVRYEIYPRRGLSRSPAALLYIQPTAHHIFEAFEEGSTIRAKNGGFLTIPIPGSPASREQFGRKPKGQTVIESMKARGVELAFVPAGPNRPAMLVAEGVRLSTRATGRQHVSRTQKRTKSGALASGTQTVPLFWLIPAVQMPKRLNLADEFREVERDFMAAFEAELEAEVRALSGA